MRSPRAVLMLAFSLLAGAASVALAARWLSGRAAATQEVVAAARDLDPGKSSLLRLPEAAARISVGRDLVVRQANAANLQPPLAGIPGLRLAQQTTVRHMVRP